MGLGYRIKYFKKNAEVFVRSTINENQAYKPFAKQVIRELNREGITVKSLSKKDKKVLDNYIKDGLRFTVESLYEEAQLERTSINSEIMADVFIESAQDICDNFRGYIEMNRLFEEEVLSGQLTEAQVKEYVNNHSTDFYAKVIEITADIPELRKNLEKTATNLEDYLQIESEVALSNEIFLHGTKNKSERWYGAAEFFIRNMADCAQVTLPKNYQEIVRAKMSPKKQKILFK